ncbi:MAG TPA: hypothetical protein ENN13_02475 [Candidatus Altiarchaeales archaeon]|nr:hypothetical protein [Candidatus Altiarchaeales archaeon]
MDFEKGVEDQGTRDKMNLLILVHELKSVSESSIAKKLESDRNIVSQLGEELAYEGLITVEVGQKDPLYKITSKGEGKICSLQKEIRREQEILEKEKIPKVSAKDRMKKMREKMFGPFKSIINFFRGGFHEALLFISAVVSAYMLYRFISNPNTEILSFLFSAVLISIVMLLYHEYKSKLKTKEVVSFLEWRMLFLKQHRIHLFMTFTMVSLIYVSGMMIMDPSGLDTYIMAAGFLMSTSVLLYKKDATRAGVVKFYAGILSLTYSVLLAGGVSSITRILIDEKLRAVDVAVSVILLFLVYVNKDFLGVNVEPLRDIMREVSRKPSE